ncbi:antitoxin Phd_YefM of type II toxin-antitoxin system [Paraburkholderia bryophila]|uniref:Antitoxin Phd_YefM of type II toxin-antitoxin system n=2 Tax=Paraburkholderia bryophila TaxID=420952 RepID=A0A329CW43_9BURK|nr:antitoxin Phd_YefM of type II toxin-antitoxin system [Paraburkholderia bryophila]
MERFVEHSPMAVMARLVMQWALHAESLDDLPGKGDADNDGEPLRELLLSMTAQAITRIATRLNRSGDARPDVSNVSEESVARLTALHDRMSRVRAQWGRSLVRDSASLLQPVAHPRMEKRLLSTGDLRVRVLDGGSMPAGMRCLPGPAGCVHVIGPAATPLTAGEGPCVLPVYDPERALIVDLLPYEPGLVHERAFAAQLVESVRPGELWILDGHFNPAAILAGWPCDGSLFVVLEHGCTPAFRALGEPREAGWLDGAPVREQSVGRPAECGAAPVFRRIEWQRIELGSGMPQLVAILTNVPATTLDAQQIVQLATGSWRDTLPLPLDAVCADAAFGVVAPRSAPLASGIAALAYNVFSAMIGVVENTLDLDERDSERLPLHMANGIQAAYGGMMIALPPDNWRRYDRLPDAALRDIARHLAVHVDPRSMRRKRRDHKASAKAQARLLATTLEHLLREDAELAAGFSRLRTIAMATRDFSSNPSRALRHASDALVMVTKYNRPVALLVSIDDWNRLIGQVRETNFDRVSIDYASLVPMSGETAVSDLH